jgi:DNA replication protein DnaC
MLNHPTVNKLETLRLSGMAKALREQMDMPECASLTFEERLGLLVDREATERENSRMNARLKRARLRHTATVEDIDYHHPRGLDKAAFLALASCQWIRDRHNCLITGPTGVGKSYLACALAHKACREGYSVLYLRTCRLFEELAISKGDGRYRRLLTRLARLDLLVLDDWGLSPLTDEQRRDTLEILEDRHELRSILVTSQFPVEKWHPIIGDPSLADAILDRLVHNAYKLTLKGDSLRKKHKKTLQDI